MAARERIPQRERSSYASPKADAERIDRSATLEEPVDWRYKSFPVGPSIPLQAVRERGWSALGGDFMLPVMVLKDSALRHNNELLASFCRQHNMSLAPHGKTSMAPQLLKMQFEAGAWAVTAATMSQVRIWRHFGVNRVILANELVEPASIHWIASELGGHPDFEFFCLVDSIAGAQLLESTLAKATADRRLNVLVELGVAGGRTGGRTLEEARRVAQAVASSGHLALAGVESFEGVIHADKIGTALEAVDRLLAGMRALVIDLDGAGLFEHVPEVIERIPRPSGDEPRRAMGRTQLPSSPRSAKRLLPHARRSPLFPTVAIWRPNRELGATA